MSGPPLWRKALYALLPAGLSLGLAEGGLHLADYEGTTVADIQATAGFSDSWVRRRDRDLGDWFLLVEREPGQVNIRANPAYKPQGLHQVELPLEKRPGELRFFALGGSTVQGMPFDRYEQGFPARLQKLLQVRHPERLWQFVNAAVGGLDSREFPDQVREIAQLNADGLVIYAGNNELVGALIHSCSDPYRAGLQRWLNRVRLLRLGRSWWRSNLSEAEILDGAALRQHQTECAGEEVARILAADERRRAALQQAPWPQRSDRFYRRVVRSFRENIERSLDLARRHELQVFLALPPINYLEPPHNVAWSRHLDPRQRLQANDLLETAELALRQAEPERARQALEQALAMDASHASANHLLGLMEFETGRPQRARELLQLAADRDYEGARITSELSAVLEQLCAQRAELRCVDVRGAFEGESEGGIPGEELFVDFCHPTFESGVLLIAESYAREVEAWLGEMEGG